MEIKKIIKLNSKKENKQSENLFLLTSKTLETYKINNYPLLSLDIQLKESIYKNIEINSVEEIGTKLDLFCTHNNISPQGKKYIKNILLQEINNQISKCKLYFI